MPGELPQNLVTMDTVKSFGLPTVCMALLGYAIWTVATDLKTAYIETLKEASKSYRSIAEDLKLERLARENSDVKLDHILAALKK